MKFSILSAFPIELDCNSPYAAGPGKTTETSVHVAASMEWNNVRYARVEVLVGTVIASDHGASVTQQSSFFKGRIFIFYWNSFVYASITRACGRWNSNNASLTVDARKLRQLLETLPGTSNCKIIGQFSIENHHLPGGILHYLCIFNRKSETIWHFYCNSQYCRCPWTLR